MQANDSIMHGYLCILSINYILKGKTFLYYTSLFSPNEYENNEKIILQYFQ